MGRSMFARTMVIVGLAIAATGIVSLLLERFTPFRLGHLPLDISIQREGFSFYFPLGTCLLFSALLSVILWLFKTWH